MRLREISGRSKITEDRTERQLSTKRVSKYPNTSDLDCMQLSSFQRSVQYCSKNGVCRTMKLYPVLSSATDCAKI